MVLKKVPRSSNRERATCFSHERELPPSHVMLSEAKHLVAPRARYFASLSMTPVLVPIVKESCHSANSSSIFFSIVCAFG